ncbi:hypothetical protein JB92DRAFT_3094292 [Gautieria morchelliformis]|nr:hypothetical protein JB92DRAFT_3094292 [Gautieria morchelliformis]
MPSICSRIPAPCHCTDCRGHLLQIPRTRERHLKADEVNHALERKRQAVARQALRDKSAMRSSPYGRDIASMHVRSSGNARHEASITTIGGFDFEQGQSGKDKPRIGVFDVPARYAQRERSSFAGDLPAGSDNDDDLVDLTHDPAFVQRGTLFPSDDPSAEPDPSDPDTPFDPTLLPAAFAEHPIVCEAYVHRDPALGEIDLKSFAITIGTVLFLALHGSGKFFMGRLKSFYLLLYVLPNVYGLFDVILKRQRNRLEDVTIRLHCGNCSLQFDPATDPEEAPARIGAGCMKKPDAVGKSRQYGAA